MRTRITQVTNSRDNIKNSIEYGPPEGRKPTFLGLELAQIQYKRFSFPGGDGPDPTS